MQKFDYNQPTRDTLAGILVEASDSASGKSVSPGTTMQQSVGQAPPRREDLFGFTVTVDDNSTTEKSSSTSQTRKPAS